MSASLNHGFARGYFATFGLVLGLWTQLVVVAAGLGAVIATSALAFAVVKWLGVAYLVWLGVRQWRAPARPMHGRRHRRRTPTTRRRIVAEAWLLNAVNPKGTAFMLAVVPQFLTPAEPLVPQYLVIAATLVVHRPGRRTPVYAALAARLLRAVAHAGAPAPSTASSAAASSPSASCSRPSSAPERRPLRRR